MRKYTYILLLLATLISIASCGARKTATTTAMQETQTQLATVVKNDLTTNENENVKIETETIEVDDTEFYRVSYAPVDTAKPSYFTDDKGKKRELNNTSFVVEKTKRKTSKNGVSKANETKQKTSLDKTIKHATTATIAKVATKSKETKREASSWWWLVLIPTALLAWGASRLIHKYIWF